MSVQRVATLRGSPELQNLVYTDPDAPRHSMTFQPYGDSEVEIVCELPRELLEEPLRIAFTVSFQGGFSSEVSKKKMEAIAKEYFALCKSWQGPWLSVSYLQERIGNHTVSAEVFKETLLTLQREAQKKRQRAQRELERQPDTCCCCL